MIQLSFSTTDQLIRHPHTWLNKNMGAKQPDNEFFRNGKRLHRIIQDHFIGVNIRPDLEFISHKFPIVEEVDFDEKTHFVLPINSKYSVHGYLDGRNDEEKKILEIKTGAPWSITKYQSSIQRKIYAWAYPDYTSVLITAPADENIWQTIKPKVFSLKPSPKDEIDARNWLQKGIDIIESGDFIADLVDGRCISYDCPYKQNCIFK